VYDRHRPEATALSCVRRDEAYGSAWNSIALDSATEWSTRSAAGLKSSGFAFEMSSKTCGLHAPIIALRGQWELTAT